MSGKKTNDLRNALKALNVSEPLRLSKNGPSLKPPEGIPRKAEVPRNEVSSSERSQTELPQKEAAQNEHPLAELPQSKDPRFEVALTEGACERKEAEIPQISDLSQNEVAQGEGTRVEHPQNEVTHDEPASIEEPQFEVAQRGLPPREVAQNEVPRSEKAKDRKARSGGTSSAATSGGSFFRLSDRAFSSPELQKLSGDCLRLFLCCHPAPGAI